MKCPFCSHCEDKVIDSRSSGDGSTIRRRRECLACEKRFTTYEQLEAIPLMVIKKNGEREQFERQKIISGMLKACEKRTVPMEQIQEAVDQVEHKIRKQYDKEVRSEQIGEEIMNQLRLIDQVAYVRFASVYKEFKDINQFMSELSDLLKKG